LQSGMFVAYTGWQNFWTFIMCFLLWTSSKKAINDISCELR